MADSELAQRLNESAIELVPVVNEKGILVGVVNRWVVVPEGQPKSFWKKWSR